MPVVPRFGVREIEGVPPDEVGTRLSIEGGISSSSRANIVALIIATCERLPNIVEICLLTKLCPALPGIFIVVLVSYQYFTIEITRRENERDEQKVVPSDRQRRGHIRDSPRHDTQSLLVVLGQRCRALQKTAFRSVGFQSRAKKRKSMKLQHSDSLESLLKIRPRSPPPLSFSGFSWFKHTSLSSKSSQSSDTLRPLRLNKDATYTPRTPLDPDIEQMLRSPNAFAEISDPILSMNFVREREETQRKKNRAFDPWKDSSESDSVIGPEKPKSARKAIEPIFVRTRVESPLRDRVDARDAVCYETLFRDDPSNESTRLLAFPTSTPGSSRDSSVYFEDCDLMTDYSITAISASDVPPRSSL